MKVKVGQLKTGLSQYLREIQATGETLEVCVRETPVAYLTPVSDASEVRLDRKTLERLQAGGITVIPARKAKGDWVPTPGKADDDLDIPNTVVSMREEKDW